MTHEEFAELAEKVGTNTQGLRPLAGHVRRLYATIRALQEDDNSFCYIAGVIQRARRDNTDEFEFMNRVKTYYHRDRQARGHSLVKRGRGPVAKTQTARSQDADLEVATDSDAPNRLTYRARVESAASAPIADNKEEHIVAFVGEEQRAQVASLEQEIAAKNDRGALTAALHNRTGRRRVVSGG